MSRKNTGTEDSYIDYIEAISGREDAVLAELRRETAQLRWAGMQISPLQGQFMQLLIRATGARRIIEVGVFTGYSSLAMALALPGDGGIVALDVSEEWTAMARRYWDKAGVAGRIELRLAPATQSLEAMIRDGELGRYDMAFIDADKPNYPAYWDRILTLLRPGGLIVVDNVLFGGSVLPDRDDAALEERYAHMEPENRAEMIASVKAIRAFNEEIGQDSRVDLSTIPVGDGLTLAVKR